MSEMKQRKEDEIEPRLPAGLELALRQRARQASDLPWLARRVQQELDYRQQAASWLSSHGGLRARPVVSAWPGLNLPLPWLRGAGAALAGGALGWCCVPLLPAIGVPAWLTTLGGISAAAALSGAMLALAASNWTRLRALLST